MAWKWGILKILKEALFKFKLQTLPQTTKRQLTFTMTQISKDPDGKAAAAHLTLFPASVFVAVNATSQRVASQHDGKDFKEGSFILAVAFLSLTEQSFTTLQDHSSANPCSASFCCYCKMWKAGICVCGVCAHVSGLCVCVHDRDKDSLALVQHGATFRVVSLTNGSSFWRAVSCNRHQAACTENRGASSASSIHFVTESCLDWLPGYKCCTCALFLHKVGQCLPVRWITKPRRRSRRLGNQRTNSTKVRNNFMQTITASCTWAMTHSLFYD